MNMLNNIHTGLQSHQQKELNPTATIAQVLSDLFCPLLIPTYAMLLATNATLLVNVPLSVRLTATLVVGIITGLVPYILITILMYMGVVSDRSISNRRERTLPFMIALLCYITAGIYLRAVHTYPWLICFFFSAAAAIFLCLVISRYWKISAHTTAAGGLAAFLLWLGINRLLLAYPVAIISGGFLLCGILGSCRLILSRHTLAQVGAGCALGFAAVYCALALFC